jgi:hypothetical protein
VAGSGFYSTSDPPLPLPILQLTPPFSKDADNGLSNVKLKVRPPRNKRELARLLGQCEPPASQIVPPFENSVKPFPVGHFLKRFAKLLREPLSQRQKLALLEHRQYVGAIG